MNMEVTSKLARLATRLSAIGSRHVEVEERIKAVKKRERPCDIILRRLRKEKARVQREMQYCEDMLQSLTQKLPS